MSGEGEKGVMAVRDTETHILVSFERDWFLCKLCKAEIDVMSVESHLNLLAQVLLTLMDESFLI